MAEKLTPEQIRERLARGDTVMIDVDIHCKACPAKSVAIVVMTGKKASIHTRHGWRAIEGAGVGEVLCPSCAATSPSDPPLVQEVKQKVKAE